MRTRVDVTRRYNPDAIIGNEALSDYFRRMKDVVGELGKRGLILTDAQRGSGGTDIHGYRGTDREKMMAVHTAACVTVAIRSRTRIVLAGNGSTILNCTDFRIAGVVMRMSVKITNTQGAGIKDCQGQYVNHHKIHLYKILASADTGKAEKNASYRDVKLFRRAIAAGIHVDYRTDAGSDDGRRIRKTGL